MTRFYATTTPGLEKLCEDEILDLLSATNTAIVRGGVMFDAEATRQIFKLKSVESVSIHLMDCDGFVSDICAEDSLGFIRKFPIATESDSCGTERINDAICLRSELLGLAYSSYPSCSFRVTCSRQGRHKYSSPEAAGNLGYGLGKLYPLWKVDLQSYDLEFVLDIRDSLGVVALSVKSDLSRRNRAVAAGEIITALNPSTAFLLCKACDIQPFQVVCDPMCGIGTIPIEGALAFPLTRFIGGDLCRESVDQAARNWKFASSLSDNNPPMPVDFHCWDGQCLPLRSCSVDVFVSDLPFGMKHGSYRINRQMFPTFFTEISRVLVPGGKAVLLTIESNLVRRTLQGVSRKTQKKNKKTERSLGNATPESSGSAQHQLYEHSCIAVSIGGYEQACLFEIRKKDSQCGM